MAAQSFPRWRATPCAVKVRHLLAIFQGYFCMVQPHRACSSGATSHRASGTMRQDASANKNKPRHGAYIQ